MVFYWYHQSRGSNQNIEKQFCRILNIADLKGISKFSFRRIVKDYVKKLNREELLSDISKYKKLDQERLKEDNFGRKPFLDTLNLDDSRFRWRIEAKLVSSIKCNYPSKFRRRGLPLTCPLCATSNPTAASVEKVTQTGEQSLPSPPLHSQSHLLSGECDGVSDLLIDCDPGDDKSLTIFFRRVVARNMELEECEDNDF